MKLKNTMKALAAALLITMAPAINAAPPAAAAQTVVHQSFATPEDAARALADAVRAQDVKLLLNVVGPASRSWLSSGDEVADRESWRKFLVDYDRKHSISQVADGRASWPRSGRSRSEPRKPKARPMTATTWHGLVQSSCSALVR